MNYWIFQVNSEAFQVDQFLHSSEEGIWWRVTRFKNEIKKGDLVFFWQSGLHRGIRAVWKIDAGPCILPDYVCPSIYWIKPDRKMDPMDIFADCRILQHFPVIEENMIKQEPGLRALSIFKFRNATNYPVTDSESKLLRSMIKAWTGELNKEIPSSDGPERSEPSPVVKNVIIAQPAQKPPIDGLYKCSECRSYIYGKDRETHALLKHKGKPVEWAKIR